MYCKWLCFFIVKMMSGFSELQLLLLVVLQELLLLMVLANLIFILWMKKYASIKCNTIENTLFHSEQISAAGAKSPKTSPYENYALNNSTAKGDNLICRYNLHCSFLSQNLHVKSFIVSWFWLSYYICSLRNSWFFCSLFTV